ncbi:uncharacterized protein LOC124413348 [Diprion similis]|uniref:uncharacterized protein LOC124413348 n=1 Tax=Diprion similis TaxID=362088 RepID=UPI001EF8C155|nr:uncharacterized protein LOC124413348 [Diprion similis]
MQEDFKRLVPRIVYTAALSDICGHAGCAVQQVQDMFEGSYEDSEKLVHFSKQKRLSRSRSKRNPRKLSAASADRQSSSSSRSPTPPCRNAANRGKRIPSNVKSHHGDVDTESPSSGYKEYLQLLTVPHQNSAVLEWGEASGDDLSSEWESDYSESKYQLDSIDSKSDISEVNYTFRSGLIHGAPIRFIYYETPKHAFI